MITGPAQRKIVLMPSSTRFPSLPNSGPRWSITGMSIARRMRSGTGVGPGICRKWRPAGRGEFWTMVPSRASAFWHINGAPWSLSLVAPGARCEALRNQIRRSRSYGVRMAAHLLPGLKRKLKAEISGDVMFDGFSRGRYATDASHYQMMPLGVVAPRTVAEAERAIAIAREEGVSVLARGGGTSQSGQTVNESLVIDCSKHLTNIYELDVGERRCVVEPGIVLDDLNRRLKPYGLWFPVDVSTASRATIGGMTANNSCGGRSLRYGTMRDNVLSVDAVLADGNTAHFGPVAAGLSDLPANSPLRPIATDLLNIGLREADEIEARFPKVQRRVGGYNLDSFAPNAPQYNLAHILLGSEGTLAFSTRIELKLSPVMGKRAIGACHFGSF